MQLTARTGLFFDSSMDHPSFSHMLLLNKPEQSITTYEFSVSIKTQTESARSPYKEEKRRIQSSNSGQPATYIYICCYLLAMEANISYCSLAKPPPAPTLSPVYATATTKTARMAVAAMAKLMLLLVVLLQVSCVLTAVARTLPGEEWLPEAGGVVRAVVEMLVSSKSGGNGHGGTTCC